MLETRPCLRTAGVCDQTASPLPPGRTSSPRLSPRFTLRGAHGERAAGIPRRGADKEHRGESVQEPPVTSQMRGPTKPCLLSGTACLSARGTGNRAALCIFSVKLFSQRSVYRLKPLSASLASDNGQGTARHGTAGHQGATFNCLYVRNPKEQFPANLQRRHGLSNSRQRSS